MNLSDLNSIKHTMIELKRSKPGKNPTKHGIVLKGLKPLYQNTLKKYEFVKEYCDDDIFVNILFDIVDKESRLKNKSKYFIDPTDHKVKPRKKLQDEIRIIPWNCSFCKKEIRSKMDDFSVKNFTCKSCYDTYTNDGKIVSELILNNSVEFTEHCKRLINKDRNNFLKYISNK
jgi:hypothetical protein